MKQLHISRLTSGSIKKDDLFLGPWCRDIESLEDIDNFVFHYKPGPREQIKNHYYCLDLSKNLISSIATSLNKLHNTNCSEDFWKIILSNWALYAVSTLHFYYQYVERLKDIECCVEINSDSHFYYNRLSDFAKNWSSQDFIHSIVSYIVENSDNSSIKVNKKNIVKPPLPKGSAKNSFTKKLVWKILGSRSRKILIYYGMATLTYKDMLGMFFKYRNVAFSYKEFQDYTHSKNNGIKLEYSHKNSFEQLVVKFIEKNIPQVVTTHFKKSIDSSVDYVGRKVIVGSPGFSQDEQLFEMALAKEKNSAKIVLAQESADGMVMIHPDMDVYYENCDHYLTWGWKSFNNYKDKYIQIASTRHKNIENSHEEKHPYVLYQTKYADICGYNYMLQITRDFKFYNQERVDFINSVNDTYLKDLVFLKLHHSKHKVFNEEHLLKNIKLDCRLLTDDFLKMSNAALFYTDYLSGGFYEALIYNVPMIISFDPELTPINKELEYYFNKFYELGVFFHNATDAAKRLAEIYPNRVKFWNSPEIQSVRKEFLSSYLVLSDTWDEILYDTLNKL